MQDEAQNPGHHKSRRKPRTEDEREIERLNTGIALVTPIDAAIALINGDKLMKQREHADTKATKKNARLLKDVTLVKTVR